MPRPLPRQSFDYQRLPEVLAQRVLAEVDVDPAEGAAILDQLAALLLEHIPDGALRLVDMAMGLGIGDALVEQLGVQLLVALEAQPGREEALAHQADLVLDLPLLPARGRRAGDRLDQIVAAHLQEAAVVLPVLAHEDRLHRRLHVMGWTPPSSPSH